MIALWSALAWGTEPAPAADAEAQALAARLLGEVPPQATLPQSAPMSTSASWMPALGLAAAGAALVWAARDKFKFSSLPGLPPRSSDLQVIARAGVGASQLLLVEVASAQGARRRLLIGAGGSSLSLVADLGDDEPALEPAESSSSLLARSQRSGSASPVEPDLVVAPSPSRSRGSVPGLLTPPRDAGERAQRKQAAMALIDEVTRERSRSSTPPTSLRAAPRSRT